MSHAVYQTDGTAPAPHVIYLNSADAIQYPTPRAVYNPVSGVSEPNDVPMKTDCMWQLSNSLGQYRDYDMLIALEDVDIPYSWYTIEGGYNDQLYFKIGIDGNAPIGSFTLTLPPGNYTPTSMGAKLDEVLGPAMDRAVRGNFRLAAALSNGMNSPFVSDVKAQYNVEQNKLSFTYGTNFAILGPALSVSLHFEPGPPVALTFARGMNKMLGLSTERDAFMRKATYLPPVYTGVFSSFPPAQRDKDVTLDKGFMFTPHVIDLKEGQHTIMVRTNLTPTSIMASSTDSLGNRVVSYSSILGMVSMANVTPGDVVKLTRPTQPARVHSQQINMIRAQLTQPNNRLVDLNNHDWSMVLSVCYVKRGDPQPPPIITKTSTTAPDKKQDKKQTTYQVS